MSEFCPYLSDIESVGSRMSSAMSLARADSRDFVSRASNLFTEESSLFSMTEDDLAIQATEKSCMVFRQIGRVLYGETGGDEELNGQVMNDLMEECCQWTQNFPHFRVVGNEIPKTKEFSRIEDFHTKRIPKISNREKEDEEEILASDPPLDNKEAEERRKLFVRELTDHLLISLAPTITPLLEAYNHHISGSSLTTHSTPVPANSSHSQSSSSSSSPSPSRHPDDQLTGILTVRSLQNSSNTAGSVASLPSASHHLSRNSSLPPQHLPLLPHLPTPRRSTPHSPTNSHRSQPLHHHSKALDALSSSSSHLSSSHSSFSEHSTPSKQGSIYSIRSTDRLPLLNNHSKPLLHEDSRKQIYGGYRPSLPSLKHNNSTHHHHTSATTTTSISNLSSNSITSNNNSSNNNHSSNNITSHNNNVESNRRSHASSTSAKGKVKGRSGQHHTTVLSRGGAHRGDEARGLHKANHKSTWYTADKKVNNNNNTHTNSNNHHNQSNNSNNNNNNHNYHNNSYTSPSKESNNGHYVHNIKNHHITKRPSFYQSKRNKANKRSSDNDDVDVNSDNTINDDNNKQTQTNPTLFNNNNNNNIHNTHNNIQKNSYDQNNNNSSRASSALHSSFKQLFAGHLNSNSIHNNNVYNNHSNISRKNSNVNKSNLHNYKSNDDKSYSGYAYRHRSKQTAKGNRPNSTHTIYRNRTHSRLASHRNSRLNTFILPNIVETRSDHQLTLRGMVVESPSLHLPSSSPFHHTQPPSKHSFPLHPPPLKNSSPHSKQNPRQQHSTTSHPQDPQNNSAQQQQQQKHMEYVHQPSTQHSNTTSQQQLTTPHKNRRRYSNASFSSTFFLPREDAPLYRSEVRKPLVLRSLKSRLASSPYNSPYNQNNYSEEISQLMKSKSKYQLII